MQFKQNFFGTGTLEPPPLGGPLDCLLCLPYCTPLCMWSPKYFSAQKFMLQTCMRTLTRMRLWV